MQMKKVGYNSKGLKLCLEKAIPSDEEIQGRENQDITKEEIRAKVSYDMISLGLEKPLGIKESFKVLWYSFN